MDTNLTASNNFYLQQPEPNRSCLLALRNIIVKQHPGITPVWKYAMPFFYYNDKMFCYLWVHKKYKQPYIGIVEGNKLNHPELIMEKRARMKIMLVNPDADLPVDTITHILQQALALYNK